MLRFLAVKCTKSYIYSSYQCRANTFHPLSFPQGSPLCLQSNRCKTLPHFPLPPSPTLPLARSEVELG